MVDISRHAITWTLTGSPTSGTFVNGDPWVVGPVTLTARTPAPSGAGEAVRNGGMINPSDLTKEGFDGRLTAPNLPIQIYDAATNAEASYPRTLNPGETLLSAVSGNLGQTGAFTTFNGNPIMLTDMSALTVLPAAPPANSFRPPYAGSVKKIWSTADVDYGLLPNLAAPFDPANDEVSFNDYKPTADATWFNRLVYNFHMNNQPAAVTMAPRNNQDFYPATQALIIGRLAMMAVSDHANRIEYANRLIQHGIDLWGCLKAAGTTGMFTAGAGFGSGRFFPILFAGVMLRAPELLAVLRAPWQATGGAWSYGTPDILGYPVGAFWETTSLYYSPTIWPGYDLPKPRRAYPNGYPLYGDARGSLPISTNDSKKDPAGLADANATETQRYSTPNLTANNWGDYMKLAVEPFMAQMTAAILMGIDGHYPHAAREFYDRWRADDKLWDAEVPANDGEIDRDGYGGSANLFIKQMWELHGPVAPAAPVQYRMRVPSLTLTSQGVRIRS